MRRVISLAVLIIMLWGLSVNMASLQEDETTETPCLPLNFLIGSELRVIGSIEAGGLPVRERVGLSEPVIGLIPVGTVLDGYRYAGCSEGRNWFSARYTISEDESIRGSIVADDGDNLWLEANDFCPGSSAVLEFIQMDRDARQSITDAYFVDDELYITVVDPQDYNYISLLPHPIMLDNYHVEQPQGILTPVDYPHADIITRELTDSLGITERVFGEDSTDQYSIHVSPDGNQILYFLETEEVDGCCLRFDMFVANADGSDPRLIGRVVGEGAMSLARVYWGTDGRVYLNSYSEFSAGGPNIIGYCMADGCDVDGWIDDIAASFGATVPISIPTTSPSGRYLGLSHLHTELDPDTGEILNVGATIIDLETGNFIQLPYTGESSMPVAWGYRETEVLIGVTPRVPEGTYDFDVDRSMWLPFLLDFEAGTYRITEDLLNLDSGTSIMNNLSFDWLIQPETLDAYRVTFSDELICMSGTRPVRG